MVQTIEIERLNLDGINPKSVENDGAIYLIIGPSGSGKSTVLLNILKAKKHFIPCAVAVSETEPINKTFSKHIPELFVYDKADSTIINDVMKRQVVASQAIKNPWLTLILDDCMNRRSNMNDDTYVGLFKTSRHYKMMVLITCQYSLDLKPNLREQCAGFFIMRNSNKDAREKLYNNFATNIPDKQTFNILMDNLTTDHSCMFIDKRETSEDWRKSVYWFRATPDNTNWSGVCRDVEKYNDDRLDKEHNSKERIIQKVLNQ